MQALKLESELNAVSIFEETDDENCEISEVFVNHPEGEVGHRRISFGMKLATLLIEGYHMHVCFDIEEGGLAQQYHLR